MLDFLLVSDSARTDYNLIDSRHINLPADIEDFLPYCVNKLDINGDAENDLGILYCLGKGLEQDYKKAAEKFEQAITFNNAQAFFNLGILNYYKLISNPTSSDKLFFMALNQGIVESNYYRGLKEVGNIKMIQGHDLASDRSDAVEEAIVRAVPLFKKSADVKHLLSLKKLSNIYKDTCDIKDTQKALDYALQATTLGDVESMLTAAEILIEGYCPRIVDYLRENNNCNMIGAEQNLLNDYFTNRQKVSEIKEFYKTTTRDLNAAVKILKLAFNKGYGKARSKLAEVYFKNNIDIKAGIELCEEGVLIGDVDCCFLLANIYEVSEEFRDVNKSKKLYNECINIIIEQKKAGKYASMMLLGEARLGVSRLNVLDNDVK